MSALSDEILKLIRARQNVTFAELSRIEGFSGGTCELLLNTDRTSNIVLWTAMTQEACDALNELMMEKKIHCLPTSFLTYLCDGSALRLPIAKRAHHYKKPHWMPVVYNPGPPPKK